MYEFGEDNTVEALPVPDTLILTGAGIATLSPENLEALRQQAATLTGGLVEVTVDGSPAAEVTPDSLTGLPNELALMAQLEYQIEGQREPDATPFGLLYIDLDDFKRINDRFGHRFGDDVLRVAADILRNNTRADDVLTHTASRLHGDEFALLCHLEQRPEASRSLLPDKRFQRAKQHLQENLQRRLQMALLSSFGPRTLTEMHRVAPRLGLTVGGVLWEEGWSATRLLHRADQAMQQEKQARRRAYVQSLPTWRNLMIQAAQKLYVLGTGVSLDDR